MQSTKLWWMGGYLCASRWRSFLKRWGGLDKIHGALQVEAMAARKEISIGINMVWVFVREAYFGGINL